MPTFYVGVVQYSSELYHYGILGMKWGVRRYQNEDGTLTEAGRKRYYTTDSSGRDRLNKRGERFNKKSSSRFKSYKDATAYNMKAVNRSKYYSSVEALEKAKVKNKEFYLAERQKWFNQEGEYRGKDYYQFKDLAFEKWSETSDYEKERNAYKQLEKLATYAAKEHPLYYKSYNKLEDSSVSNLFGDPISIKKINYGQSVVDSIMKDFKYMDTNNIKGSIILDGQKWNYAGISDDTMIRLGKYWAKNNK